MRKLIGLAIPVLFLSIGLRIELSAQQPFIVPTESLGQYGYLEVNATTYARLSSNTFNARELAARWWTGAEHFYYTGSFLDCNLHSGSTSDYASSNHTNWTAGTIAYVAVRFKDCSFNWNPTNYNERSFQLMDVDNAYGGAFDDIITDDPTGVQNLVGSFTINSGGSALTLDRLWVTNTGTAQEGSDISNDGIRVYYEVITGFETYDGTESFQTLYGDYNGNNTGNEEWGNENLNLPITAAGVRCYVVVSDLAATPTSGLTALFQVQNDGISFQEVRDVNYNKLRVNAMSISTGAVLLPVELLRFQAALLKGTVNLHWETASEHNNDRFEIERSVDGTQWPMLGVVYSHDGSSNEAQAYTFEDRYPVRGLNYYRLKQVDTDGKFEYSTIIAVENANEPRIQIYPNPAHGEIYINAPHAHTTYLIKNATGRMVQAGDIQFDQAINISALPAGVYFMQVMEEGRVVGLERVVRQ